MKKLLFATALTICCSLLNATNYTLKLRSGDLQVVELPTNSSILNLKNAFSTKYVIVQFNQVPTESEKQLIASNGIELLEYLPHNAFIANIENVSTIATGDLNIRGIIPFLPAYKLSNAVADEDIPNWAVNGNKVDLMIESHLDISPTAFRNSLVLNGYELLNENIDTYFEIRLNQNKLEELKNNEFVKAIDFIPAPPEKEDQEARTLHRGNMLDSEHPLGRKYDGTGVSIAIADDAVIGPHIDIKGRVTSFATSPNGTHGDMTTGIAMGAGNLNPNIRGMATNAYLYYYDIGGYPHIANAVSNLNNRGVVITSTSFSEGCNAGYTSTTRTVDQQTRQNPELLHVFSAGNSSSSTCGGNAYGAGSPWGTITGGRKQGKSTIATGNLNYNASLIGSSSRGPAADGRIKPDICANGGSQMSTNANNTYQVGGGTSAAAPGIAGLAAQLYQGFRELNGGVNPESALIKSAMLTTARDLGNKGPDFTYGWGRVNAHRAMKLIEENRYLSSNLTQGNSNTHTVSIASNVEELKFMVYWTDYEASTVAAQALVNNLDFKVITPNGDTILPYILDPTPNTANLNQPATRGIDDLNNMEQVQIDTVSAGTYTLLVEGTTVPQGPQKYYVVWETKTDEIEVTYPSGGESFTPGRTETIRWDATGTSGSTLVHYSVDSGLTWISIAVTNGTARSRDWVVPNTVTGDLLIRVTKGTRQGISAYPASIIGIPTNITTVFRCPDSLRLSWNAVPGATAYEVSLLGATHMDSVGRSDTNSIILYNVNLSNDNWVSVKALGNGGIVGQRANAVPLGNTVSFCPFNYDVNVDRLISPTNSFILNCGNTETPVTVAIINNGDSNLVNIPLKLTLGALTYYDTVPGPLAPTATLIHTFKDTLDLSGLSSSTISVVSELANDENNENDSLGLNVSVLNNLFSLPYSNDFENFNTCGTSFDCGGTICNLNGGWINGENGVDDDFDMRVDFGGTPSNGTGPAIDHNPGTNTGKYIYSEASNGCFNNTGITISPCFDLSNTINPEFSFWYHMNGTAVGNLRVDVYSNGAWTNNVIPAIVGSQGNIWRQQLIDMTSFAGQIVNFRFTVTTGPNWSSDIAIDDVMFVETATGIDEASIKSNIGIFPNPSNGEVTLRLSEIPQSEVQILDINGRLVKEFMVNAVNTTLNLGDYAKGIYFVRIKNTTAVEKMIIQ